MKHVLPRFRRPIESKGVPRSELAYWTKAMEAYDARDHRNALINTLLYINPDLLNGTNIEGPIQIVCPQGSAVIQIDITEDAFSIRAPFLRTTESTNKIALYRRVAEVNFHPLKLTQIQLRDDILWFEHQTKVELCNPYKVYDLLKEISLFADNYDDEFIEKFDATFYQEPKITPLNDQEKELVWLQLEEILSDYKKYSAFFQEKRWNDFQYDIAAISILKIVNMPYVHGTLRTTLESYVVTLFDTQTDFKLRTDKSYGFMEHLCNMGKEDYFKNIYHAESLISPKWRSSAQTLQNEAKRIETNVNNFKQTNDNLMICYYLQEHFQYFLYLLNVEEHHKKIIYNVLEAVSGQEIDEAAPQLLQVYQCFLDGTADDFISTKTSSQKGFFSRFFGKTKQGL